MADFSKVPSNATVNPTKFTVSVPDSDLADFKSLLKLSKIGPETFENRQDDPTNWGISREWLTQAKKHWETEYDWRATEKHLNSFPQFTAPIKADDGTDLTVHFVGLFSQKPDAVPIIFLHGWPGSFLEFIPMLGLLKAKYSPQDLPINAIVPSLPGYGFSTGAPLDSHWKTEDIASAMNKLMEGLGFGSGYIVQGGDLGSFTARVMVVKHNACKAMHNNFNPLLAPPEGVPIETINAAEAKGLEYAGTYSKTANAYAMEHATRPATIGLILSSSPLALLAWIGEKFLSWSDEDPSMQTILDGVTLYWLTQCFPRSIYPYRQYFVDGQFFTNDPEFYCKKPMGHSWFPREIISAPLSWIKTTGNVVWHRQHDSGGHFAAMEKPEVLLQDVEDFAKQVWPTV